MTKVSTKGVHEMQMQKSVVSVILQREFTTDEAVKSENVGKPYKFKWRCVAPWCWLELGGNARCSRVRAVAIESKARQIYYEGVALAATSKRDRSVRAGKK